MNFESKEIFSNKIVIIRVHQGGCRWGVAPLKEFFGKKSQRGDQGKIYPSSLDFLRNLRENLKGGGDQRIF
jgi:hypothetical protein